MNEPVKFSVPALRLIKRLEDAPRAFKVSLARAVDFENELTISHIQQNYLSRRGPDTLGVVTNRLRSSIRRSNARVVGNILVASIGSNVAYAGVHEYGFDGPVQVRAHTRKHDGVTMRKARIVARGFDVFEVRRAGSLAGQSTVSVRAHTRHARYAERRPIRRGIADRVGAYSVSIERAALDYLKGGAK